MLGLASADSLPMRGGAPSFPREVQLPVAADFVWPVFTHFCVGEHSGHFREAAARCGFAACSVADRPTTSAPSRYCMHVIGTAQQFFSVYPHPVAFVEHHVECGAAITANRANWARNFLDGSMRARGREFVWCMSLGEYNAGEQPSTAYEFLVGPPTTKTNATEHGCCHPKQWWWWQRNLPHVPPSDVVPRERWQPHLGGLRHFPAEQRMLLRCPTPESLAAAHMAVWRAAGNLARVYSPHAPRGSDATALVLDCAAGGDMAPPLARVAGVAAYSAWLNDGCPDVGNVDCTAARLGMAAARGAAASGAVYVDCACDGSAACVCDVLVARLRGESFSAWCSNTRPLDNALRRVQRLPALYAQFDHNLSVFGATYAPRMPLQSLECTSARRSVIVVPVYISPAGDASVLSPMDGTCFAAELPTGVASKDLAASIARFLPGCAAATLACYAPGDPAHCVFVVPCRPPLQRLRDAAEVANAAGAGVAATWCAVSALAAAPDAYLFSLCAVKRIMSIRRASTALDLRIGAWANPRPLVRSRVALQWGSDAPSHSALAEWQAFLRRDADIAAAFRVCLARLDRGDGLLLRFAEAVVCVADFGDEIPVPPQGLPRFEARAFNDVLLPERPAPLCFDYLVYADQPVPNSYTPLPWSGLLRLWGRRLICSQLDHEADRQFNVWAHGSSDMPRQRYLVLGPGAMTSIPHSDGIGSWLSSDILWEYHEADGLFHKLDFNAFLKDHKSRKQLRRMFGNCSDQELLSLMLHGVRWKAPLPRQYRIANNLESLDPRLRSVSRSLCKLVHAGLYVAVKLRRAGGKLDPDGPPPVRYHPQWSTGKGGADKKDNPSEARPVGDASAPHGDVLERNHPHARACLTQQPTPDVADGPIVVSLNELTGPSKPPSGYDGPVGEGTAYPWPSVETKPRPRDAYRANVVIRRMADANGTGVVAANDDVRWMFFQFLLWNGERWVATCYIVLELDGEPWFCLLCERVANMGTRPMSKIACRFAEEFLDVWRLSFDAWIRDAWLPHQTHALQTLLSTRRQRWGPTQARPYWAAPFTDDFKFIFAAPDLGAKGMDLWTAQCATLRLWMSEKKGAGTVSDWIGGRYVENAGFGCLVPHKRARAIASSHAALAGALTRDELRSHVSFLVHADDLLNFPLGARQGLMSPLHGDAPGHCLATVVGTAAEPKLRDIIELLQTRPAAPFSCAVDDARHTALESGTMWLRMQSDACTDSQRLPNDEVAPGVVTCLRDSAGMPHVCGCAEGVLWLFRLDTEWLRRHITLIEGCGPFGNVYMFAGLYPLAQLLQETDASAAAAASLWRARVADLQYLSQRAARDEVYRNAIPRLWTEHVAGIANDLTDAGSRGMWDVLFTLASAFGIRIRFLPPSPALVAFFHDVCRHTTPLAASPAAEPDVADVQREWLSCVARLAECMRPLVADLDRDAACEVRVDRSTPWGNFSHPLQRDSPADARLQAVASFAHDLVLDGAQVARVRAELAGRTLGCHCLPLLCHGHVLAYVANAEAADLAGFAARARAATRAGWRPRFRRHLLLPPRRRRRLAIETGGGVCPSDVAGDGPPFSPAPAPEPAPPLPRAASRGVRQPVFEAVRTALPPPTRRPAAAVPMPTGPEPVPAAPSTPAKCSGAAPFSPARGSPSSSSNAASSASRAHGSAQRSFSPVAPAEHQPLRRSRTAPPSPVPSSAHVAPSDAFVPFVGNARERRVLGLLGDGGAAPTADAAHFAVPAARPGSPQPLTAAAARRASAQDVASRLALDPTPDAICPDDPDRLRAMCNESRAVLDAGLRRGTTKSDAWGFKWMVRFCQAHNIRWMRPRFVEPALAFREDMLPAFAIMWLAVAMSASARRTAQGFTGAKASSCLLVIYAWRRVLRDCKRHVGDMRETLRHLRGLNARYRARWGDDALVPQKRRPFKLADLLKMCEALTAHTILEWSADLHFALLVLICFCLSTGMRRDEWSKSGADDASYMRRSNFVWFEGDREIEATPAALARIRNGCYLRGKSAPSKCDRDNLEWGARDMWFLVDDTNPLNFASRYLRYERRYPCPPAARRLWAAFSPDGGAAPFGYARAADLLLKLMTAVLGSAQAAHHSWHAFRVTIACAIFAKQRGNNEGLAQMLVRWKSPDSVRTYAHMLPSSYANLVEEVTRTDAHPQRDMVLPDLDPCDAAADVQRAVDELERDLAPARAPPRVAVDSAPPSRSTSDAKRASAAPAKPAAKRAKRGSAAAAPATVPPAAPPVPAACPATLGPGGLVIVPAGVYPSEVCTENAGAGWSASVRKVSRNVATLVFSAARASDGSAFAPVKLAVSVLRSRA